MRGRQTYDACSNAASTCESRVYIHINTDTNKCIRSKMVRNSKQVKAHSRHSAHIINAIDNRKGRASLCMTTHNITTPHAHHTLTHKHTNPITVHHACISPVSGPVPLPPPTPSTPTGRQTRVCVFLVSLHTHGFREAGL